MFLETWNFETQRGKTYLLACGPNRDANQPAHVQPDQSLRCLHDETVHPWQAKMRREKILIRLRECAGWSESSLGGHAPRYIVWRWGPITFHYVIHVWLIVYLRNCPGCILRSSFPTNQENKNQINEQTNIRRRRRRRRTRTRRIRRRRRKRRRRRSRIIECCMNDKQPDCLWNKNPVSSPFRLIH